MSEYHDDKSAASDPAALTLSDEKLQWLQPESFGWKGWFLRFPWNGKKLNGKQFRIMLAEHISTGDSRAAIVAKLEPLVIAAYTDEMDCVVLLEFPSWLVVDHNLRIGSRLLTVNTYGRRKQLSSDLIEGPLSFHRYQQVFPVIAEFISNDTNQIEYRKRQIKEDEWRRTVQFTKKRLAMPQTKIRDGRPLRSGALV